MVSLSAGLISLLFAAFCLRRLRAVDYVFGVQSLLQVVAASVAFTLLVVRDGASLPYYLTAADVMLAIGFVVTRGRIELFTYHSPPECFRRAWIRWATVTGAVMLAAGAIAAIWIAMLPE